MRAAAFVWSFVVLAGAANAADVPSKEGIVAKRGGALLARQASGWKPVAPGDSVKPGDLLIALPEATLKSAGGSVELQMVADIGNHGSYPVLESALTWGGDGAYDLDATLRRGVVLLHAPKEKTKARIQFAGQTWVFAFHEAGTVIAIETYGRLAPGAESLGKLMRDGFKEKEEPNFEATILVLKGKAFLDFGTKGQSIVAPPGPAHVSWNNISGRLEVSRVEKTPENVAQEPNAKEKAHLEKIRSTLESLNAKEWTGPELSKALAELNPELPRLGIVVGGALDRLDIVTGAMLAPKQEVREAGIRVLRHWLGREEGQIKKLHDYLIEERQLKPVQARNFIQLVVGYDERERNDPDTFDILIANLTHKNLAVRELCHWHLIRLTPGGKEIPFDAAGPAAALEESQRRWRELIPAGKVPTPPQSSPKDTP